MMLNNIDDYINQIELLKQALFFYANADNYKHKHKIENKLFSYIDMDCGTQAKFALKQIENLNNVSNINLDDLDVNDVEYLNNELRKQIIEIKQINTINDNTD